MFTPGPWNINTESSNGDVWITDSDDNVAIAKVTQYKCCKNLQEGNSRLMVSAPDMYDALKLADGFLDEINSSGHKVASFKGSTWQIIKAAIAKVEGRQPE